VSIQKTTKYNEGASPLSDIDLFIAFIIIAGLICTAPILAASLSSIFLGINFSQGLSSLRHILHAFFLMGFGAFAYYIISRTIKIARHIEN